MPKLSDLLAEKAKAEIQVGGLQVAFTFYVLWRDRFSDAEFEDLLATNGREYFKKLLPRVLQSWDLVDDEAHAIAVTADAIEQYSIPDAFLAAVEQRALGSDLAGKARNSNNSQGT